jgi:protocatechuate 3,4-dioxygenase beta subunit
VTNPQHRTAPAHAAEDHDRHDDHGGLVRDLPHLMDRRRALAVLGGLGAAGLLAACSSGSSTSSASSSTSTTAAAGGTTAAGTSGSSGAGAATPTETAGPFPADGSNGPNLLTDGAVVRSDIRSSIGELSGTADGIETTVELELLDAATGGALAGAALYLWQCDAGGAYSIYEVEDQNYLRGVQVADEDGRLSFTTVFPGCYQGRWPHWHFEVFASVDDADAGSDAVLTSQIALPRDACEVAYADDRYGPSADNLSRLSIETDGIFSDGVDQQLASVSGSNDAGYTVSLTIRT